MVKNLIASPSSTKVTIKAAKCSPIGLIQKCIKMHFWQCAMYLNGLQLPVLCLLMTWSIIMHVGMGDNGGLNVEMSFLVRCHYRSAKGQCCWQLKVVHVYKSIRLNDQKKSLKIQQSLEPEVIEPV